MKNLSLLLARLFLGLCFFAFGWTKVSGDPVFEGKSFSQTFEGYVQSSLEKGRPFGFWRPILEHVVRPRPRLFAAAVAWGELLLGASLLLGALVSFSAVGGIALMASIRLNENPFAGGALLWQGLGGMLENGAVALLLLLLALNGAGRFLGLDAVLFRKRQSKEPQPPQPD